MTLVTFTAGMMKFLKENVKEPGADLLDRYFPFTPNTLTVLGPILAAIAFVVMAKTHNLGWLFVIYLPAAATDFFDGTLAVRRNMVSDLGAFVDTCCDRCTEFFVVGAIMLFHFSGEIQQTIAFLAIGTGIGTSIIKMAAAEKKIPVTTWEGREILGYATRAVILILGIAAELVVSGALVVLLIVLIIFNIIVLTQRVKKVMVTWKNRPLVVNDSIS